MRGRQLARRAARALHTVDPVGWRMARWQAGRPESGATLLCIYRGRHASTVQRLVAEARELGVAAALWALDEPDAGLQAFTVGSGRGLRLALLNRLWAVVAASTPGPLVIADDDVSFARGGLRHLLGIAAGCGFGLAQPGHAPGSRWNHRITFSRPLTLARVTTFVEVGPMLVLDASWRHRVLPFPEEFGMGWGLDILWHNLVAMGCRLGVVDAVSIRHLVPVGLEYDSGVESRRVHALLDERGLGSISDIQRTVSAWRVWQRRPPWSVGPRGAEGPPLP